jgi:hypothetical protein
MLILPSGIAILSKLLIAWPLAFLLLFSSIGFAIGSIIQLSSIIAAIVLIYILIRSCFNFPAPELQWLRWVFRWLASHLDGIEPAAIPSATQPTIYAYHPHGLYAVTPLVHMLRGDISASLVTVPFAANFPIMSVILRTLGITSSDKENIREHLQANKNIAILVGGVREAEETRAGEMRLCASRKGIFEVAIETGSHIVPILCYGENEIFRVWKPFSSIQNIIKNITRFTLILPYMGDIFTLLMRGCPNVKSHIGEPILPTENDTVDTLREKYKAAFIKLYAATRPPEYKNDIVWI